ncbi:hypothetical protein [Paenibacillus motobuensis]
MKKIVAVFGALSTVLFMVHLGFACVYYAGLMPYSYIHMSIGGVLSIVMSVHMLFAIILMVRNRQRDKKAKTYPGLNGSMMLQFATGILTGVFLLLHVLVIELNKSLDGVWLNLIYGAVELLFILIVSVHIAVSVPKHFISMGWIRQRAAYPLIQRRTNIFLALMFVLYAGSQIRFWTV